MFQMKSKSIDLGPTMNLDDEALQFGALADSDDETPKAQSAPNNARDILNDGHDSLTFSADDLETFGALVTDDAITALERFTKLAKDFVDAQAAGDSAKAEKLLDDIHTYFTE